MLDKRELNNQSQITLAARHQQSVHSRNAYATTQASTQLNNKRPQSAFSRKSRQQQRAYLKPKKKMIGVLGLTRLDEDDPLADYYRNKEMQASRPFGIKEIYPNLKQEYEHSKKDFSLALSKIDKRIKENNQKLDANHA